MRNDHPEIVQLMEELNSLHDGELAIVKLISHGSAVIPYLRDFLLTGSYSTVYQPRQWAVQALGILGAKEVLIDYLSWPRGIDDPAVAYAEEAVEISAARELKRWHGDDVYYALLNIITVHAQPGAIEALGEFDRPELVPYFIHALEDDICRAAAEEALRKSGDAARALLLGAAMNAVPSRDAETPSSLRRRESALRLLAELKISPEQWHLLRPLLSESHSNIVVCTARVAAQAALAADRARCVRRLNEIFPQADWLLQVEIDDCLAALRRS